jgi:hypothetical protein
VNLKSGCKQLDVEDVAVLPRREAKGDEPISADQILAFWKTYQEALK